MAQGWLAVAGALLLMMTAGGVDGAAADPAVLRAEQFGAVGDGHTDDGPAVLRMLDAAAKTSGPVRLQFAPGKTYFLKSGRDRYAFPIAGARDLTLDGGGCLFLVDSQQRFLKLTHSRNITLANFGVDYVPLPFADGTILRKDKAAGTIDVKIDDDQALPPAGGPTHEDGEQAYFGSLWHRGPYVDQGVGGTYWVRNNFDVQDVRAGVGERVVQVQSKPGDGIFDAIVPGEWRFSVPVRGIAHRFGPGESFQIHHNRDVVLENIELWSAPWFAFGISNNEGRVELHRVNVRPKPGTTRNGSSWRDGFHVKNNRASLLFEDCVVEGTGDDAFNIATHASTVREIVSPTRIRISQNFPLGVAAMEPGDTLVFYSPSKGAILGRAHITHADPVAGDLERAPVFTLDLDAAVAGLEAGKTLLWNEQSSNPDTVLRGCRVDTSCRFRSPVTLENCQFNALAWFTGDEIEAPVPSSVVVKSCQFRLGQGNPSIVIATGGPHLDGHGPTEPVIDHVLFQGNRIWGDFILEDASHVTLIDNNFAVADRAVSFHNDRDLVLRGNVHGGRAVGEG